jgi:hypothetical protein
MIHLAVAEFFKTDIATSAAALGAVITALAAIFALIYASRQLESARDATRIELTFRLYEHQLTSEFANHIAKTADFLAIDQTGRAGERAANRRWRRWNRMDRSKKSQILLYLNHLEAVGGLYESGRLDEKATMELFGLAAATFWARADWLVKRLRGSKPGTGAAFDKWEALAREFNAWEAKQK